MSSPGEIMQPAATYAHLLEDTDAPIMAPTVCAAFQRTVERHGDLPALRTLDGALDLTWSEVDERVRRLTAGLAAIGIGHQDTVAMLLPNTPECHLVDFAAIHLGAVPFTIYNSSSPEQIAHQLTNADARVIVTQADLLTKAQAAADLADGVENVVVCDGPGGTMSLAELEAAGAPDFDFNATWQAVGADDLVTMIFTSGTTGPPKGAQYAHRTVMAQLRSLGAALPLPSDAIVSFLPMAHAGGRLSSHYMALVHGAPITTCADMKELPLYLAKVRPDVVFAVPRLWEKFQVAIEAMIEGLEGDAKAAAKGALAERLERVRERDGAGGAASSEEDEQDADVFLPVLARLGLDRMKVAFVGGAPCAPEVVQFFRAVGVPLLEAYGLTEGCLNVFNRVEEFKTATAGRPLPGVELRLAEDGEILIRSELVFVGYRKQPEETSAALDADGWLHTGDIGALDDDGYLKIVDRKKEIIINAAGKNMSPVNIESAIKGETSLIGQVVTIGDGRRYNTALVTLDPEAAPVYAKRLGLDDASFEDLAASDAIRAEVDRAVAAGNERLSRPEQIKKYTLLGTAWLPDSDELTPTLKLKRKPIAAKYATAIDAMYAE